MSMSDVEERLRWAHPLSPQYAAGSMLLIEAADEIARLQSEVERLSNYIILNGDQIFSGDWACAQCHPNSDILVDGFECGFHLAQRLKQQAAESENE